MELRRMERSIAWPESLQIYLMDRLVLIAGVLILGRVDKAAFGAVLDTWSASVLRGK
jgi:hypothetical protein